MASGRLKLPGQTVALAGIPAGVQAIGPWAGHRQLFVKFAGEAETATMFTADALRRELKRLASRSRYHSIALAGRDPLAEEEFLAEVLRGGLPLPVLLDHDGQRPEELQELLERLAMVQVVMDGTESDAMLERACESIGRAAGKRVGHAMVLTPADSASDGQLLRIVDQVHAASAATAVVVHPALDGEGRLDRRWELWLEHAAGMHPDVRLAMGLPAPTGMR